MRLQLTKPLFGIHRIWIGPDSLELESNPYPGLTWTHPTSLVYHLLQVSFDVLEALCLTRLTSFLLCTTLFESHHEKRDADDILSKLKF